MVAENENKNGGQSRLSHPAVSATVFLGWPVRTARRALPTGPQSPCDSKERVRLSFGSALAREGRLTLRRPMGLLDPKGRRTTEQGELFA